MLGYGLIWGSKVDERVGQEDHACQVENGCYERHPADFRVCRLESLVPHADVSPMM